MNIIISIIGVLLTLGVVILIHEFGHFMACKLIGIRVLKFACGFGKEIYGFDWKGTRYSFGWIPMGGYLKPAGEDYFEDDGPDKEPPHADDYFGKPWYLRLCVVVAGPFMNYVLALCIFSMVFFFWGGDPTMSNTNRIGEVASGMPADQAGLKADDRIIRIDDTPVTTWNEMAEIIHGKPDVPLTLKIERDQKIFDVTVTPQRDEDQSIGLIGIMPHVEFHDVGLFRSVGLGLSMTWMISVRTLQYIGNRIRRFEKPKDVSGPIGIIKFISDAARSGMRDFLSVLGLLSVAIGLFNLFPIPMLDGGHLVFYLFEGILRKPLNKRVMLAANYCGMVILLSLLVYASYNDITRLRKKSANTPPPENSSIQK